MRKGSDDSLMSSLNTELRRKSKAPEAHDQTKIVHANDLNKKTVLK